MLPSLAFKNWAAIVALTLCMPFFSKAQYCTNQSQTPCSYSGIAGFQLANVNNQNNACDDAVAGDGYSDYTSLKVYLKPGGNYQATLAIYNDDILDVATIWFDWNNDSTWTEDELTVFVGNQFAVGPLTAVILVPPTAVEGVVGRCRIISDFLTQPIDACGNPLDGEIEDYHFIVTDSLPPSTGGGTTYCTATSGGPCTDSGIGRFTLANVDNDNQLCDKDGPFGADGYSDYTNDFLVVLNETTPYTATMEVYNSLFLDNPSLWVDWDASGTWELTEIYKFNGVAYSANIMIAAIVPPPTAVTGQISRMRVVNDFIGENITDPCAVLFSGEIEDYNFILLPMGESIPECVDTSKAIPKNNSTAQCNRQTLHWPKITGATGYQLTVRDTTTNTFITTNLAVADTFYTIQATLTPGNTYRWIAKPVNGTVEGYNCDSAVFTTSPNFDPVASIFPGDSVNVCRQSVQPVDGNPSLGTTPYSTHTWTGAATNKLSATNIQNPTFVSDVVGMVKLFYTVTDANGCTGKDSIVIKVLDLPANGALTSDKSTYCSSDSIKFTLSGYAGTVSWQDSSATHDWQPTTVIALSASSFAKTGLSETSYFRAELNNGNCSNYSNKVLVTLNATPDAPVIAIMGRDSVCPGETSLLKVTNYSTGIKWNDVNNTSKDSLRVSSGTYTATYTDALGCKSSAAYTIYSQPVPAKPTVVVNVVGPYCDGDQVTMTASGANISWTDRTGVFTTSATYTVSTSGHYIARETNAQGCYTESDSVVITMNPLPAKPVITASKAAPYCDKDTIKLNANGTNLSWSVNNGTFTTSAFLKVYANGDYVVKTTDANGCVNTSDTKTMVFNPLPPKPSNDADSPAHCKGDTVKLSSNAVHPMWNTGAKTTTIQVSKNGSYFVKDTSDMGCIATSDTFKIVFDAVPNKPTLKQQGDSLKATASNVVAYHWFDSNNVEVAVTTTPYYRPSTGGSYRVRVENAAGCLSLPSESSKYSGTGIIDLTKLEGFKVYPNPASNFVILQVPTELDGQTVVLEDALGRMQQQVILRTGENRMDFTVSPGVYLIRVVGLGTMRVVVQ